MKCPNCRHKNTRVTVTEHRSDHTVRYNRCLDCKHKFKTEERIVKYLPRKPPTHAKLNHSKVRAIRAIAKENEKEVNKTQSSIVMELALKYDVEYECIKNVIKYKTWKNVD